MNDGTTEYQVRLNVNGKTIVDQIRAGDHNTARKVMKDRYGPKTSIQDVKAVKK